MRQPSLSITVPALNEECNLPKALESMIDDCRKFGVDWEVIIIDDGSTDGTGKLAEEMAVRHAPRIKVLHHQRPMGIGASIRDGVQMATKDAVTWLPGDGENDPGEIFKFLPLLEHVDFVIPYVINKDVRSRSRQRLSRLFLTIVNATFGTFLNYTNGNVIYKRSLCAGIKQESTGFFFQTECIVKSIRRGYSFAEVPIRIRQRQKGASKALTLRSLRSVTSDYFKLIRSVYFRKI